MTMERYHRNVEGFVADFGYEENVTRALKRSGMTPPEGWVLTPDNFRVESDQGRILVLSFYDWDADLRVGIATLEVGYDEVSCWA